MSHPQIMAIAIMRCRTTRGKKMSYTMQTDFIVARMRHLVSSWVFALKPEITIHRCDLPGIGMNFIAERDGHVVDFGKRLSSLETRLLRAA